MAIITCFALVAAPGYAQISAKELTLAGVSLRAGATDWPAGDAELIAPVSAEIPCYKAFYKECREFWVFESGFPEKTAALQPLIEIFPARINRENLFGRERIPEC
jgi:hypothetical protein